MQYVVKQSAAQPHDGEFLGQLSVGGQEKYEFAAHAVRHDRVVESWDGYVNYFQDFHWVGIFLMMCI